MLKSLPKFKTRHFCFFLVLSMFFSFIAGARAASDESVVHARLCGSR